MLKIRSAQDFGAGLVFALLGIVGIIFGRDLAFGSAARMGPGYFPILISGLLIVVGVAVMAKSMTIEGPQIQRFALRPIIFVNAALLVFGFAIESLGLAVTSVLMTLIAALSRNDTKWRQMIVFSIGLAIFAVVVFVYALGLPLKAWWG